MTYKWSKDEKQIKQQINNRWGRDEVEIKYRWSTNEV